MTKLRDCIAGCHGECDRVVELPYLDENNNIVFVDRVCCDCWCHNNED